jgi:chemotaxis protein methyltransferase CheR
MTDSQCVEFLQWALPRLRLRWPGFRKVRRQVHKRIDRRLGELSLSGAGAYRAYLESHPSEWQVLDSCCRITISRFYRDRGVFDYLGQQVLPELAERAVRGGDNEVRCWSVGCASGEEAYTLAILGHTSLAARFPNVRLTLAATDADEHLLQRARRGRYPASSVQDVPADWLGRFLMRSGEAYVVRPELREQVDFQQQDIRHAWPEGTFHLVLCRNLAFTYFDDPLQREILRGMVERIVPGGVLVVGKHESLPVPPPKLSPCGPNLGVYRVSGA